MMTLKIALMISPASTPGTAKMIDCMSIKYTIDDDLSPSALSIAISYVRSSMSDTISEYINIALIITIKITMVRNVLSKNSLMNLKDSRASLTGAVATISLFKS